MWFDAVAFLYVLRPGRFRLLSQDTGSLCALMRVERVAVAARDQCGPSRAAVRKPQISQRCRPCPALKIGLAETQVFLRIQSCRVSRQGVWDPADQRKRRKVQAQWRLAVSNHCLAGAFRPTCLGFMMQSVVRSSSSSSAAWCWPHSHRASKTGSRLKPRAVTE